MINKNILKIIGLFILLTGVFVLYANVYQKNKAHESKQEVSERDVFLQQFKNEDIQLSFNYPDGPDGYVIDDVTESSRKDFDQLELVRAYTILNKKEKTELENSTDSREGPPSISLKVFKNTNKQSASMWVDAFPQYSNSNLKIREINRDYVVAGANAASYKTDGLYLAHNVVVAHGDFIYQFTGSYNEEDSYIYKDFFEIINSIVFIPGANSDTQSPGSVSGNVKLDVRAVCTSALAYMLFESSEQADMFIEECVLGKHPDVIDRYIQDLGLDGAVI